jgi:hypothetical protein
MQGLLFGRKEIANRLIRARQILRRGLRSCGGLPRVEFWLRVGEFRGMKRGTQEKGDQAENFDR